VIITFNAEKSDEVDFGATLIVSKANVNKIKKMIQQTYSKKLMKHFKNPKFVKEIKNPDGVGEVGNIICGDVMRMKILVEPPRGHTQRGHENLQAGPETFSKKGLQGAKIKDIGFQTFGCPAAVASSDVVCSLAKGKTLEQAKKITKDNIVKELGGMPTIKIHCSVLGIQALRKAIENYERHKGVYPKRAREPASRPRTYSVTRGRKK